MYQAYLKVISQLISSHQAVLTIGERQIFIDVDSESQKWTISSTLLSQGDSDLNELFPESGAIRWQVKEHFLRREASGAIMFFEYTTPLKRFIDFRAFFKEFLEKTEEFDTVFAS